jgi:cysteine-rich repeat protein
MFRQSFYVLVVLAAILAIAGCMNIPEPSICANGTICPPGMHCVPNQETCSVSALCGNGLLDEADGEDCDDGGDTENCNANCTLVSCGDGIINSPAGEQCDPPRAGLCSESCQLPGCGNGIVEPGEECDGGRQDTLTCDANCTVAICGDGYRNQAAMEECEDGNEINTDSCTAGCKLASCSDGFENENEIDVDCGGHCGPGSCSALQRCSANGDCVSGVCLGETCVPDWTRLVTGGDHTCALLDSGSVRCWGRGDDGQPGYGTTNDVGDNETPASKGDVNVGGAVRQIAAGGGHTCAVLDSGSVRCWGAGSFGRLGYGNSNNIGDDETPASLPAPVEVGGPVRQLALGWFHTCALLDSGVVRCWGWGPAGRLGYGKTYDIGGPLDSVGDDEPPTWAPNLDFGGTAVRQLAAGSDHTCALLDSGAVHCWGAGTDGKLGYGNTAHVGDDETPAEAGAVNVTDGGDKVIQLAGGGAHTCALLGSGAVRCWGRGAEGQLGYGKTDNIGDGESPASAGYVDVGGTVIQLAAGFYHTCALLDTGAVRCWGRGTDGQLGYGDTSNIGDYETPASKGDVNVGGTVRQIAAGHYHTCALLDTGAVRCWGRGVDGRLGYGSNDNIGDGEFPATAGDVPIGGMITSVDASLP